MGVDSTRVWNFPLLIAIRTQMMSSRKLRNEHRDSHNTQKKILLFYIFYFVACSNILGCPQKHQYCYVSTIL